MKGLQQNRNQTWRIAIVVSALTILFPMFVAAQTATVLGTGNANLDVPAVQAAVDQGGSVTLVGNFSFDRPATKPAGATYNRMVTVTKSVVISGAPDSAGNMTTIDGGELPFAVDAFGAQVTIEQLRFTRPKAAAINVFAVSGLLITDCRIEGVVALPDAAVKGGLLANGVLVGTSRNVPNATQPGHPENFSGNISIVDNDIDMQGLPDTSSLGVVVFAVGRTPDRQVDVAVSGNHIRNTTEPAINFRYVGGAVQATRNIIETGSVSSSDPDVIRIVGSGLYFITQNMIDCAWGTGAAIHVAGQAAPLPAEANATVADNRINMEAPEGTVFDDGSAAIEILGFAQQNLVANNQIRGRAAAAITITDQNGGIPANNTLASNNVAAFVPSLADVFLDAGVLNTVLMGKQGSLTDNGTGTIIMPLPDPPHRCNDPNTEDSSTGSNSRPCLAGQ